jgi:translation initiation factor 2 subunit 1
MINLVSKRWGKSTTEVREIVEDELYDMYGSLYDGFEELAAVGLSSFKDLNFSDELKQIMFEVAEASIQITTVTLTSTLRIRSYASDGIQHVKELLKIAEDAANVFPEVKNEITTIGAPVYRIFLEGLSYPEVEEVHRHIEIQLEEAAKTLDVEYLLEKEGTK